MKYLIYLMLTQFKLYASAGEDKLKLFPNLPVGEFKLHYLGVLNCESTSDLMYNLHLYKKSLDSFELRGNITYKVPFDDTFMLQMNLAVKDSIGGWKDNAHVYRMPRACSSFKSMLGEQWPMFVKSFGFNKTNCPISPGAYVTKGHDLSKTIENMNGPKTFFYGTYKCRIFFTDKKNNVRGCIIFVLEVKRPWETT